MMTPKGYATACLKDELMMLACLKVSGAVGRP